MTPPINIGGDTVDAITIDGTSVSEVTVDGDVVFSTIPDEVVDQFESYAPAGSDALTDNYNGNTADFGIGTSTPQEGNQYLQSESSDGSSESITSTSELPNYIEKGDLAWSHIRCESLKTSPSFMFGLSDTDNTYRVDLRFRDDVNDVINLTEIDGGNFTTLDSINFTPSNYTSEWLRLIIDWKTTDEIAVTVQDSNESEIGSLSATNSTHSSNDGVGFLTNPSGDEGSNDEKFDNVIVDKGGSSG